MNKRIRVNGVLYEAVEPLNETVWKDKRGSVDDDEIDYYNDISYYKDQFDKVSGKGIWSNIAYQYTDPDDPKKCYIEVSTDELPIYDKSGDPIVITVTVFGGKDNETFITFPKNTPDELVDKLRKAFYGHEIRYSRGRRFVTSGGFITPDYKKIEKIMDPYLTFSKLNSMIWQ